MEETKREYNVNCELNVPKVVIGMQMKASHTKHSKTINMKNI